MAIKTIQSSDKTIEVNSEDRITFKDGLYAFENYKHFYLIDLNEDQIFQLLQSEDNKDIAFIVINPYLFKRDYVLNVRENDLACIDIANLAEAKEALAVLCIVTTSDDTMTANLLGPLIVNTKTKRAKQALDLNEHYTTKHDILQEMQLPAGTSEVKGVSAG